MINNELLRHAPNEHVLRLLFTLGAVGAGYTLQNDLRRTAPSIYAILFALPFSPKHIGALRVHEFRLGFQLRHKLH